MNNEFAEVLLSVKPSPWYYRLRQTLRHWWLRWQSRNSPPPF